MADDPAMMQLTTCFEQKTKILTLLALAALSAIIFLHYFDGEKIGQQNNYYRFETVLSRCSPADIRPGRVLTGLFFMLLDARPGK